jgi:hypothetical protein
VAQVDSTPDLTVIEHHATRQALSTAWSTINGLRAQVRDLTSQVAAIPIVPSNIATASQLAVVAATVQSQQTISQDHPYFVLRKSADQSIPDSTSTPVTWDVDTPLNLFHDLGPGGGATAPIYLNRKPGIWIVGAQLAWADNQIGERRMFIAASGPAVPSSRVAPNPTVGSLTIHTAWSVVRVGTGDVACVVNARQGSGGALLLTGPSSVTAAFFYYLSPIPVSQ